jgi:hypothetical protein
MYTLTPDNRAAIIAIAETLWTARKALNASDVHGIDALATGYRTGSAYDHTTDALRAVILPLVGGDEARAAEVLFLLADNYESVAYNLDVEARAHADAARDTLTDLPHARPGMTALGDFTVGRRDRARHGVGPRVDRRRM